MISKSKIEWCDYTVNPVKGLCPMACSYCYARAMYKRFKWNPEIRFQPETLLDLETIPSGSKVFIGSTFELFHDAVRPDWLDYIFWACEKRKDITSIFLTKRPENLQQWSPFPDNAWVGVSATDGIAYREAIHHLYRIKGKRKFISFEPLLQPAGVTDLRLGVLDWVIIGAQTKPTVMPKIEWVREIVEAADRAHIPVFLKDSLKPLLTLNWKGECSSPVIFSDGHGNYRQEMP